MRLGVLLLAVPLSFAGCVDDDEALSVAIEGAEYAFAVPSAIEGGVAGFDVRNTGREVHEFLVLGLPADRSLDDLEASLQQLDSRLPPWVDQVGGVPLLNAGEEVRLTRELDEGRYALICTFPSPKGVPHWKFGWTSRRSMSASSCSSW